MKREVTVTYLIRMYVYTELHIENTMSLPASTPTNTSKLIGLLPPKMGTISTAAGVVDESFTPAFHVNSLFQPRS